MAEVQPPVDYPDDDARTGWLEPIRPAYVGRARLDCGERLGRSIRLVFRLRDDSGRGLHARNRAVGAHPLDVSSPEPHRGDGTESGDHAHTGGPRAGAAGPPPRPPPP